MKIKKQEIDNFVMNLYTVAQRDTAYPANQKDWTEDNRFCGHCAIVVALIYEKIGGEIKRGMLKDLGYSHYWNCINGINYDATFNQFSKAPTIVDTSTVPITRILGNDETLKRYNLLKQRYEQKFEQQNEI